MITYLHDGKEIRRVVGGDGSPDFPRHLRQLIHHEGKQYLITKVEMEGIEGTFVDDIRVHLQLRGYVQ